MKYVLGLFALALMLVGTEAGAQPYEVDDPGTTSSTSSMTV